MKIFDKLDFEDKSVYRMTSSRYVNFKKWGEFMQALDVETRKIVIERMSSERQKEIYVEFERDSYILSRSFLNILKGKKIESRKRQLEKEVEIEELLLDRKERIHSKASISGILAGALTSLTSYLVLREVVPYEIQDGVKEAISFSLGLFAANKYYKFTAKIIDNLYLQKLLDLERQKNRLSKLESAYQDLIDSTEKRL